MSDNKALVIITTIILATTTILFLAIIIFPLFFKNPTQQPIGLHSSPTDSPLLAVNQNIRKEVLGASILHINRDVQLDGGAWINGDLYLNKNSTLHIGDVDITKLLLNAQNGNTPISTQTLQTIQNISQTGVLSLQNQTGNLALTAGTGISIAGLTINNNDLGSAQNIFKTIFAGDTFLSAKNNNDSLTFASGSGILLTAGTNNTITVATSYGDNPSVSILTGAGLSGGGTVALGNTLSLTNSGVLSITGTQNQITTSGSTGDITLSLPQNINATASPTFAGLSLSSTATTSSNLSFRGGSSQINVLNGSTLGFYTSPGGDGGLSANPALFVSSSGKIGIGTNNPGTNALQINGGTLYVNGNSNAIIADGIVRSNTLFWMSNGGSGISSLLRLEDYNGSATGLSLSSKLAGTDGSETEWPYQTIIKDTTWTATGSTRNAAITFNTLFNNASKEVLRLASTGFVGIGSSSPLATLDIRSQSGTAPIASISGKTSSAGLLIDNSGNGQLLTASSGGQTKFTIDNAGNTRIVASLCVKANINANCAGNAAGTIYATNQTIQNADYAENYVSGQTLFPGDIIMTAKDGNNNAIVKTTHAYQSETIGVVSTNPGITLNSNAQVDSKHPNLYPVALSGRVPVFVSDENGPIHTGDFITTSSISGVGMKAIKQGVVIGKALEDFDASHGKTGKILVYINIGWANPEILIASDGSLQVPIMQSTSDTQTTIPPPPASDTIPVLQSDVRSLQSQVASISSQLQQIQDLSDQLKRFENLSLVATSSASIPGDPGIISGNFSVIGRTLLSDVGITGKITTGLLTINGLDMSDGNPVVTINTTNGSLKLQSLALGGLDILNGKITIDISGNTQINASLTAKKFNVDTTDVQSASAGKAVIQKGKTSIDITTKALTNNSFIFATPDTIPVAIAKKQISPDTFELTIAQPLIQDLRVDWWIVN